MKKTIALTFLMLANLLIVAHAVVPHHYHDQVLDITFKHGHNNAATDSVGDPQPVDTEKERDFPGHEGIEDSILSKICIRYSYDKQSLPFIDFSLESLHCLLPVFLTDMEFYIPECLSFTEKPYLLSSYSAIITQSTGLRAPPVG